MISVATAVRDALLLLGDPNNPVTKGLGTGTFDLSSNYSDINVLELISKISNSCVTNIALRNLLNKKKRSDQPTSIDVWQRSPNLISGNYTQVGHVKTPRTARVPIILDQLFVAKMFITSQDVRNWDHAYTDESGKVDDAKALAAAMAVAMYEAARQLYDNIALRAVAFLEANASVAGGLGTVLPTGGNFKEISALEQNFMRTTHIDVVEGNNWNNEALHYLIGSSLFRSDLEDLVQLGVNNNRNAAPQTNYFDHMVTKKIVPTAGYKTAMYAIEKNGVAFDTWAHQTGLFGAEYVGQKKMQNIVLPVDMFPKIKPINAALYSEYDFADSSGVDIVPESVLNDGLKITMGTTGVFVTSFSSVPNQRPIVKLQRLI